MGFGFPTIGRERPVGALGAFSNAPLCLDATQSSIGRGNRGALTGAQLRPHPHHQLPDRAAVGEFGDGLAAVFEREHLADIGVDLPLFP
jgi:hypothetical protein